MATFSYPEYQSAIYIFDVKTAKSRVLLQTSGRISPQGWSRDGKQILVASFGAQNLREGIWAMDPDGQDLTYLGEGYAAAWSPIGDHVATLSCRQPTGAGIWRAAIRVIDVANKTAQVLPGTEPCASNFHLAWAPNGSWIVYSYAQESSIQHPSDRIFLMDPSPGQTKLLIDQDSWAPTWFSDSDWIALVRGGAQPAESSVELYSVRENCSRLVSIPGLTLIGEIALSPDGTQLAITAGGNLYVTDLRSIMGEGFLSCP